MSLVEDSTDDTTLAIDPLVGLRERSQVVTCPILVVIDAARWLTCSTRPGIARCQLQKIQRAGHAAAPS